MGNRPDTNTKLHVGNVISTIKGKSSFVEATLRTVFAHHRKQLVNN